LTGISNLSTYMADANAPIRFILDLFPHLNEYIFFFFLHTCSWVISCVPHGRNWNWVTWTM